MLLNRMDLRVDHTTVLQVVTCNNTPWYHHYKQAKSLHIPHHHHNNQYELGFHQVYKNHDNRVLYHSNNSVTK